MSSPKVLIDIAIAGTRIFGKALFAAGQQAVKNAKARPQGGAMNDVAGIGNATSGSVTDRLTRDHRLTLDEAHLILNAKKGEPIEKLLKNYEYLFKANSPPPPPEKPVRGAKPQFHSHYLLSKVARAKERIEAEFKLLAEEEGAMSNSRTAQSETPPRPPPPGDPPAP